MALQPRIKLIARNATAARQGGYVSGNPATTRPESGVGNCYPGLEIDLRNLERRFFPFLAFDFDGDDVEVVEVDVAGAQAAGVSAADRAKYQTLENDMDDPSINWRISRLHGFFGPLGERTLAPEDLNGFSPGNDPANPRPPDMWTAIRLLEEDSPVDITLSNGSDDLTLSGVRRRYLDADGSFAPMFEPGELTQSLCSPWTHDFRDCGCYYWASNHPDIALPPLPAGQAPQGAWNRWVGWQRADRGTPENPSAGATAAGPASRELEHIEINGRWQELDIVLETRERRATYAPTSLNAAPFPDEATLVLHLRWAAGVELAVIHEYLAAMYSLDLNVVGANLRDDVASARAELLRILYSEMIHLRKVNDVLRAFHVGAGPFVPALRVAATLRGNPVVPRRLEPAVLTEFIELERPSATVDGLYGRILATLEADPTRELQAEIVRGIMVDGLDHFQTFEFIAEWLGDHPNPEVYLLPLNAPTGTEATHQQLQLLYQNVLTTLRQAYTLGLPGGAAAIVQARTLMLGPAGLEGRCEDVRAAGLLVTFDAITNDPDFAPMLAPPP